MISQNLYAVDLGSTHTHTPDSQLLRSEQSLESVHVMRFLTVLFDFRTLMLKRLLDTEFEFREAIAQDMTIVEAENLCTHVAPIM